MVRKDNEAFIYCLSACVAISLSYRTKQKLINTKVMMNSTQFILSN